MKLSIIFTGIVLSLIGWSTIAIFFRWIGWIQWHWFWLMLPIFVAVVIYIIMLIVAVASGLEIN